MSLWPVALRSRRILILKLPLTRSTVMVMITIMSRGM